MVDMVLLFLNDSQLDVFICSITLSENLNINPNKNSSGEQLESYIVFFRNFAATML